MSIVAELKQVPPAIFDELIKTPELVPEFFYYETDPDCAEKLPEHLRSDVSSIYLDKTWQAIHFLLTGKQEYDGTVLGNAIMGGKELEVEIGYGPVRYLTSPEVKAVAQALSVITVEDFMSRYNPDILNENKIYPEGWTNRSELTDSELAVGFISDEEYLEMYYKELIDYYLDASKRENGMFLCLT